MQIGDMDYAKVLAAAQRMLRYCKKHRNETYRSQGADEVYRLWDHTVYVWGRFVWELEHE